MMPSAFESSSSDQGFSKANCAVRIVSLLPLGSSFFPCHLCHRLAGLLVLRWSMFHPILDEIIMKDHFFWRRVNMLTRSTGHFLAITRSIGVSVRPAAITPTQEAKEPWLDRGFTTSSPQLPNVVWAFPMGRRPEDFSSSLHA